MTDKNQTMWAGIAVVVGVIVFSNMGVTGGTFSIPGKAVSAEEPAVSAPAPAQPSQQVAPQDHELTTRAGQPSIVTYKTGDQKIEASIADARAHLAYFWQHAEHPQPGETTFTLKVAFPVTKGDAKGREHMWVLDIARNGATMTGRLDNEPDLMKGVHSGDTVTFSDDMVTDWGFRRNGKIIGFYSTRAMLDDAPPDEAAYIRSLLGENPQ